MKKHFSLSNFENEGILIEQCSSQNPAAVKYLYENYYGKMFTICVRYLKNEEDAMEVVNTGFLKVFDKISSFKRECPLEQWIRRVIINTAIDFIRSNKDYKKRFIQSNEFNWYGEPKDDVQAEDELSVINDKLTKEEILEIILSLPPATRSVFNMYVIEDFSHKEIATRLKISVGTSKWHLSNARKLLMKNIQLKLSEKNNLKNESKHFGI